MITAAPEWAFRKFAHARFETRDGRKVGSHISGSCVTGGFPGLCLDNDDFKELAERFLIEADVCCVSQSNSFTSSSWQ